MVNPRARKVPVIKKNEPIRASECETEHGTMHFMTANGEIEFKIPTGALGIDHFDLLSKAVPQHTILEPLLDKDGNPVINEETGDIVEIEVPSPKDIEMYDEARKQWIKEILPIICISPLYEDMRGEDQNICFRVAFETIRVDQDQLFRPCK